MNTRELALMYRVNGATYREIAEKVGISTQRAHQICGRADSRYFRHVTSGACIYPNLANWMNENRISCGEFVRRMEYANQGNNRAKLRKVMKGEQEPQKGYIDKMLAVTGLTYEELFAVKEEHDETVSEA